MKTLCENQDKYILKFIYVHFEKRMNTSKEWYGEYYDCPTITQEDYEYFTNITDAYKRYQQFCHYQYINNDAIEQKVDLHNLGFSNDAWAVAMVNKKGEILLPIVPENWQNTFWGFVNHSKLHRHAAVKRKIKDYQLGKDEMRYYQIHFKNKADCDALDKYRDYPCYHRTKSWKQKKIKRQYLKHGPNDYALFLKEGSE